KTVDCMMKCQWIDFESVETAKQEITKLVNEDENCRILKECMLCFSCDEYCPYNSHPFDKINELQEKFDSQGILPGVAQNSIDMYKAKGDFVPRPIDPTKPVLDKCAFPKMNTKEMKGPMFDDLQSVGGLHYFCQLVYQHVAKPSIIAERVPIILENFIKSGVKKETEVICWHDECYGLFTSYCQRNNIEVPFKPVHIFEYVYNYLKENESKIKKLDLKVAYQRNCSNRYVPETDNILDKICELIGVERVARKFDRENGLCCAAPFGMRGHKKEVRKTQNDNVQDMVDYGAQVAIFNCPMCKDTLERKVTASGMKAYFISDLARLALGEKLDY
ncbi:MAG: (Fe-S)-binding protein, partial [Candidatus Lokiarchaeota archaeon]|nr:(Fe-S)-binding protein [Candidatus Lokiarchaeota archaeon]